MVWRHSNCQNLGSGFHWYLVSKSRGRYSAYNNDFLKHPEITEQPPVPRNELAQIVKRAKSGKRPSRSCFPVSHNTDSSSSPSPHPQVFPNLSSSPYPTQSIFFKKIFYLVSNWLSWVLAVGSFVVTQTAKFGNQWIKNPPAMQETQETWVHSLVQEEPLEKDMANHSSVPDWRIPQTKEPIGLYPKGWTWLSNYTRTHTHTHTDSPVVVCRLRTWD